MIIKFYIIKALTKNDEQMKWQQFGAYQIISPFYRQYLKLKGISWIKLNNDFDKNNSPRQLLI